MITSQHRGDVLLFLEISPLSFEGLCDWIGEQLAMKKPPRTNELLRQARQERGWTQRNLARELSVQVQTVGSWELGTRSPSPPLRHLLCTLFSKTPEELGLQPP